MGQWEWLCEKCSASDTDYCSYDKSNEPRKCERCGTIMEKQFPANTTYKFNCLGSSKDYKHREDQQKRRMGIYNKNKR